ncbi:hypothetical protein ACOK01_24035 [Pseudosulfitobacter pseudonitzschiae]
MTMSLPEKLLKDEWDHGEGDHRIEHLCAMNPDMNDRLAKLALRFISEKGLSQEFADLLDEIEVIVADDDTPSP